MPGAGRTRESCVQKNVHSAHASNTGQPNNRHSPRNGFTAYNALSPGDRA